MSEIYFLDTSALLKRYVQEEGTKIIDRLYQEQNQLMISSITLCEIMSNLRRLVDVDRVITGKEFNVLRATFWGDVGDGLLELIEVTTSILLNSLEIITKKYVTPLDAMQLATALSLPDKPVFVCSDVKLLRLAKEYGLNVLNPQI